MKDGATHVPSKTTVPRKNLRAVRGSTTWPCFWWRRSARLRAEGWRDACGRPSFLPAHARLAVRHFRAKNVAGLRQDLVALKELGADGEAETAVLEVRCLSAEGDHAGRPGFWRAAAATGRRGARAGAAHPHALVGGEVRYREHPRGAGPAPQAFVGAGRRAGNRDSASAQAPNRTAA
jgi:hypothetical protein